MIPELKLLNLPPLVDSIFFFVLWTKETSLVHNYFIAISIINVQLSFFQTFKNRTHRATSTESNQPHFLCVPNARKSFHRRSFVTRTAICDTYKSASQNASILTLSIQGTNIIYPLYPHMLHSSIFSFISITHIIHRYYFDCELTLILVAN